MWRLARKEGEERKEDGGSVGQVGRIQGGYGLAARVRSEVRV